MRRDLLSRRHLGKGPRLSLRSCTDKSQKSQNLAANASSIDLDTRAEPTANGVEFRYGESTNLRNDPRWCPGSGSVEHECMMVQWRRREGGTVDHAVLSECRAVDPTKASESSRRVVARRRATIGSSVVVNCSCGGPVTRRTAKSREMVATADDGDGLDRQPSRRRRRLLVSRAKQREQADRHPKGDLLKRGLLCWLGHRRDLLSLIDEWPLVNERITAATQVRGASSISTAMAGSGHPAIACARRDAPPGLLRQSQSTHGWDGRWTGSGADQSGRPGQLSD
jgi:hypothetical protein